MNPRVPDPPHLPDRPPERGNFVVPLALNMALMLAIYLCNDPANELLEYLFGLGYLALANTLATVVAAVTGYAKTAMGLGLSILLIFLVGLGSCAVALHGDRGQALAYDKNFRCCRN